MLPLMHAPAALNVQFIDASSLPLRALQATGARFVITSEPRDDLPAVGELDDSHVYRVPGAARGSSRSLAGCPAVPSR